MKKRKDTFKENMTFDYTELTALCEHLEIREREGKRLKIIDKYSLVYDKCEQRDIRYCAVIFSNILMHSDFVATCEQEGWEYVTSRKELYIFRTQNPNATEIITDDKDYFRIITKRFLLHPSFLGFSWATINILIRIPLTDMKNINLKFFAPYTTDIVLIFWLFLLIAVIVAISIKTSEYIEWYLKAKKAIRNGKKIPLLNLEQRTNKMIARNIIYCIWLIALFSLFIYTFLGYLADTDILYTIALIPCILSIFIICGKSQMIGRIKVLVLSTLCIVLIMSGTYALALKFDKAYEENTKIIKEKTIPVTVAHFGCKEKELQETELDNYEGNIFAQFYSIDSYCPKCERYIHYTVFVSNYYLVQNNFINALKKENKRAVIYQDENSKWDEQYRIFDEHALVKNYGFAVKNNTIVYLSFYSDKNDNIDFFDVAYNKMFG